MAGNANDYPLWLPGRVVRSALHRSRLLPALGRAFWRETSEAPWIHCLAPRDVDMFAEMPTDFADEAYTGALRHHSERLTPWRECLWAVDDALVEPNRCLVIGPGGRLVTQSRRAPFLPLFPNARQYVARGPEQRFETAVVYDGRQSSNYFHHVVDGLVNLAYVLKYSGLPGDTPLIINRWMKDSPFLASLLQRNDALAALNWHVLEPGQWARVERAYLPSATPFDPSLWATVRGFYPPVSSPGKRRLFLSRDRTRYGRCLRNEAEIGAMLSRLDFETVYAEQLSVEQQQAMFEECEVLVALHGMGMIQQMFMDQAHAKVLEIMPADRLQTEYYWQAWTLGQQGFDVILGTAMDARGDYDVDPVALEMRVRRMLDLAPGERRYGEAVIPA